MATIEDKNILVTSQVVKNAIDDMTNIPEKAVQALTQRVRILSATIQIIDESTGDVIQNVTGKITGGSVRVDATSLIRRTTTLDVVADNDMFPRQDSLIWFGKKMRIYVGLTNQIDKNEYNYLLGTYWVNEGDYTIDSEGEKMSISVSDKMSKYDDAPLENKVVIKPDTPVSVAIKKVMEALGETDFGFIQESSEKEVVPYTLEFKVGDKAIDIITKLRDMYMDYTCGFDLQGRFEYRKITVTTNDEETEPKWFFNIYDRNVSNLLLSYKNTYNLKNVRNRVIVYGRTFETSGYTPSSEVTITDPDSPFNIYAIGKKTVILTEDKYVTEEQCSARARYEVLKQSTFQETASIETVPLYCLDANDIIDIIHPKTAEKERYRITGITIPLDTSSGMTIQATKLYFSRFEYGEYVSPIAEAITKGINDFGWLYVAEERIRDCYKMQGSKNANLTVRFNYAEVGGQQAYVASYPTTKNQSMVIDLADFKGLKIDNPNGETEGRSKGDYLDRVLGHEMFHAVANDYVGYDTMVQVPTWFNEGMAEFLHGAKERYLSVYTDLSSTSKKELLLDRMRKVIRGEWSSMSEDYVASYLICVGLYKLLSTDKWNSMFSIIKTMPNPSINFLQKITGLENPVDKIIEKVSSLTDIWTALDDKNNKETMSIGGKYFMNLYNKELNAENVFENMKKPSPSLGFNVIFER